MTFIIFAFGLSIGSFLNVCIYRLPLDQSIVYPSSFCTQCKTRLRSIDLIPVLSWIKLKGKCHHCGAKISSRYTAIELLTGTLFLYAYFKIGLGFLLINAFCFFCFLIVVAMIDYDHQIILDSVLLYAAGAGMANNLIQSIYLPVNWSNLFLGALVGSGILFLIVFISRGMGEGDALFAGVLGLWLSWKFILITLYIAFLIGGMIAITLLLTKKRKNRDTLPFGSILAIAAFIVYVHFKIF